MATPIVIAKVSSLNGEAYVKNAAGELRRLKQGDSIYEGESVVTMDGARVMLQLADGRDMMLGPDQQARLDTEVAAKGSTGATPIHQPSMIRQS